MPGLNLTAGTDADTVGLMQIGVLKFLSSILQSDALLEEPRGASPAGNARSADHD